MASTSTPTPQTFEVAVNMNGVNGLDVVLVEVTALDYATAYRAAVEQMLIDPVGTMQHRQRGILEELGYVSE